MAEHYGADPEDCRVVRIPTAEIVAERYAAAVEEFICEPPETIGTALALVEFSGVIAAETLLSRVLDNSGPVRMRPTRFTRPSR